MANYSPQDLAKHDEDIKNTQKGYQDHMEKVEGYEKKSNDKGDGRVSKSDLNLGNSLKQQHQTGMGAIENFGNLWPTDIYEKKFAPQKADPKKLVTVKVGNKVVVKLENKQM